MTNKNCHVTIIISQSLRQNNIMGKFMPLFSPPFSPIFPPSSFPFFPPPFSPFLWFPPPPLGPADGGQAGRCGGISVVRERRRGEQRVSVQREDWFWWHRQQGDTQGHSETPRRYPRDIWVGGERGRHLFEKISSYQFWTQGHPSTWYGSESSEEAEDRGQFSSSYFICYISLVCFVYLPKGIYRRTGCFCMFTWQRGCTW